MEQDKNRLSSLFPNVAAQLRTSLGNLHLAAAQLVPAEAREQNPELDAKAAILDQSYYQMLRLVNSLSMAAYLTDDSPLPLQNRDMVDLVGSVCAKAGDLAPLMGLELRFVCAKERHICAVAPDAQEQVLYHLLSNAFKFSSAGSTVTVELRFTESQVILSVTDSGCGIPEDRLASLFDRYLDTGRMDPPPYGLGLGLPLCRCLIQRQGGTLMAESKVDHGSRFTVMLPNRITDAGVSDISFDYSGGFNRTLMALADTLPASAFLLRNQ